MEIHNGKLSDNMLLSNMSHLVLLGVHDANVDERLRLVVLKLHLALLHLKVLAAGGRPVVGSAEICRENVLKG